MWDYYWDYAIQLTLCGVTFAVALCILCERYGR
jgi:hypothetical protein